MSGDWFERLARHPHLLPADRRRNNGGAEIMARLAELHAGERLSLGEFDRRQRDQLRDLAPHVATYSPHFAARLKAASLEAATLAQPGGLAQLPPLTRRELVRAGESLFCTFSPPDHGAVSATTTSGSTGEPVTLRRTDRCRLEWMACTLREHLWHQRDFAGRLAIIRASFTKSIDAPEWGPPASLLFRTGPASVRPPSSSVHELAAWLSKFQPAHLLILPSILAGLLVEFAETGQRLPGLQTIRTLSETVPPALRETTHRILGVPIHDSYTSQEGGVMATQCPEGRYHVSESILLEVLKDDGQSCGPGETGRVVVTDLLNFATPLIRYEIGDYATVGAPCPCGRGLPVIQRFLGRERNLLLLPDGTRHWPMIGFHRWSEAFPVRQFQFEQLDRTTILARLSATGRPSPDQEARLTAIIQSALQHPFTIRYEWHEAPLPRGPGGKFEEFLCRAV